VETLSRGNPKLESTKAGHYRARETTRRFSTFDFSIDKKTGKRVKGNYRVNTGKSNIVTLTIYRYPFNFTLPLPSPFYPV
jgi:hypothetical protein